MAKKTNFIVVETHEKMWGTTLERTTKEVCTLTGRTRTIHSFPNYRLTEESYLARQDRTWFNQI